MSEGEFDESLLESLHFVQRTRFEEFPNVLPSIRFDDDEISLSERDVGIFDEEEIFSTRFEFDDVEGGVGGNGVEGDTSAEIRYFAGGRGGGVE